MLNVGYVPQPESSFGGTGSTYHPSSEKCFQNIEFSYKSLKEEIVMVPYGFIRAEKTTAEYF
ncbi:MAG: hypothetical protein ABSB40_04190 [Nitrososphaeria archaeon]|jgi:hypothetical protein